MRKAKVTVPAVATNLGPGVSSLALALGLHVTVRFVERTDSHLLVESHGTDVADLSPDCYHPVMYAAVRVFQQLEDGPSGLRVDVRNAIPMNCGLGAEAAMTVAGLVGANNLMGAPLDRDTILALGTEIVGRADGLVAAMLGGLTVSTPAEDGGLLYRRIDVDPFKFLVIVPDIDGYDPEAIPLPSSIELPAVLHNLGGQLLLTEALREKDFDLLKRVLSDHIIEPHLARRIPGYDDVVQAALQAGALGVSISGNGPALLVFTLYNHYKIADAIQQLFDRQNILSRVWTLTVDTQGVVVMAAETRPN
jgi:homoserine kinase